MAKRKKRKKEFAIGEIFQCGLIKLVVKEQEDVLGGCEDCIFFKQGGVCTETILGPCDAEHREDRKEVKFIIVD